MNYLVLDACEAHPHESLARRSACLQHLPIVFIYNYNVFSNITNAVFDFWRHQLALNIAGLLWLGHPRFRGTGSLKLHKERHRWPEQQLSPEHQRRSIVSQRRERAHCCALQRQWPTMMTTLPYPSEYAPCEDFHYIVNGEMPLDL